MLNRKQPPILQSQGRPSVTYRNHHTNDPYMGVTLGDRVRDTLTGFTGVVTARAEYLTGCNQCLVLPQAEKTNELKEAVWFDVERLHVEEVGAVEVNLFHTPTGCDAPSPKGERRA